MRINKNLTVVLKGMLMGAADVVPGVSGGTIAFITGIYEELIATIDELSYRMFPSLKNDGVKSTIKEYNLTFLGALLLGITISVVSLSKLITYLLESQPILVWSFFFGLVLASILYIGKQITKWNVLAIIALIIGTALSYYITIAEPLGTADSWWYLIFSGSIAIIAMILPGVSGAFLLLLLGSYQPVLNAISGLGSALAAGDWTALWTHLKTILLVGLGALVGIKIFSRILKWLFDHYENVTLALLTGFMVGSLNKLWPWKDVIEYRTNSHGISIPFLEKSILPTQYNGDSQLIAAIIIMVIGFVSILLLERWASVKEK